MARSHACCSASVVGRVGNPAAASDRRASSAQCRSKNCSLAAPLPIGAATVPFVDVTRDYQRGVRVASHQAMGGVSCICLVFVRSDAGSVSAVIANARLVGTRQVLDAPPGYLLYPARL